jgi:NAD/NADP transhydrogenase alpha subunit
MSIQNIQDETAILSFLSAGRHFPSHAKAAVQVKPNKTLQMDFWGVGVNWICARIDDATVTGRSHGDIYAFANKTN